jgi:hypothetical protein
VHFGEKQPLPGVGEWLNPEAEMTVDIVSYRRSCDTQDESSRVTLLPDAAAVRAWQAANDLVLVQGELAERPYALIEIGVRAGHHEGFAVSRAGGRRGDTAYVKITSLVTAARNASEPAPSAPCALVGLPPGPWARVRVIDQTRGAHFASDREPL